MDFLRAHLKTIFWSVAAAVSLFLVVTNLSKIKKFLVEVYGELKKVSWSTRQELIASTILVIVTTSILTLFIFVIDSILSKGLHILFR